MKKILFILFIGVLAFFLWKGNIEEKVIAQVVSEKGTNNVFDIDINALSTAYGYLKGQQFTLDRIKKEYPELNIEVIRCELEFSLSFKNAAKRIENKLKEIFGNEFKSYEINTISELTEILNSQKITKELSLAFIEDVKLRAKGKIESPVLETLLTYQFINSPSKEIYEGFVSLYSTEEHPKSKGITIDAKLPLSWKQKEGDRPNIIQKFISENGKGQEFILFMVKDLGLPNDYILTNDEIDEIFTQNMLKQMVPDGGEFISAKKILLDNQIGAQMIFKITEERLDFSLTMKTISFITIYEGKFVFLQCYVSAEQGEDLDERFNLFLPLFRQVANSLILIDQY